MAVGSAHRFKTGDRAVTFELGGFADCNLMSPPPLSLFVSRSSLNGRLRVVTAINKRLVKAVKASRLRL
eukprot:545157-Prymnesium_polylepis.1